MNNQETNPYEIRRAWSDASAARFLREVILKRSGQFTCYGPEGYIVRGRDSQSTIATDSKRATTEPTVSGTEWMTCIQPDAKDMREASAIAEFYSGVSFSVGQQREAAYRLRKLERSLES